MKKLNLVLVVVFALAVAMLMAKTGHATGFGFSSGF